MRYSRSLSIYTILLAAVLLMGAIFYFTGYDYGLPWLIMAAFIVLFTFLSWTSVAPRLRPDSRRYHTDVDDAGAD